MSDPRYHDPRLDPPPVEGGELRNRRIQELDSSNAMWGWVAGAVVLALVLVFVFTKNPTDDANVSASIPKGPASIASAPASLPTPPSIAPSSRSEPSTTGSGGSTEPAAPAPETPPAAASPAASPAAQ